MLRHFQKSLECFPFSRISPEASLRIYAMEFREPPLIERRFDQEADAATVIESAREFANTDCAFQLECHWDLWQYETEWQLTPAPVNITCFGPEFDGDYGEHIRVELGTDALFLPDFTIPGSATPVRSNIRSLLHLVSDFERILPVSKKTIWSESGENLAERLQAAASASSS